MTENECKDYISKLECPKCKNGKLNIYFSICHDDECCGGYDHIDCDKCDDLWIEGRWYNLSKQDIKLLLDKIA